MRHRLELNTHVHVSVELLLCVEDGHVEGAAGHVVSGPLDLYPVIARLSGVVLAEDDAVLLRLALHLHTERSCRRTQSEQCARRS